MLFEHSVLSGRPVPKRIDFSGQARTKRFLLTKPKVYTKTRTMQHHINIQTDKNFLTKMLESKTKKRIEPEKNIYRVQPSLRIYV